MPVARISREMLYSIRNQVPFNRTHPLRFPPSKTRPTCALGQDLTNRARRSDTPSPVLLLSLSRHITSTPRIPALPPPFPHHKRHPLVGRNHLHRRVLASPLDSPPSLQKPGFRGSGLLTSFSSFPLFFSVILCVLWLP